MEALIHMTAQYSNAVLVAVLPHFSDFAAKLDLPVPQPITLSQVATSKIVPFRDLLGVAIWLTNGYWFVFHSHRDPQHGYVSSFSGPKEWYHDQVWGDEEVRKYFGVSHMTADEAVALARATLLKLGWEPRLTHADLPPTYIDGPSDMTRLNGHLPWCQVDWEWPPEGTPHLMKNHTRIVVRINTETKKVEGIESVFGLDNPPPHRLRQAERRARTRSGFSEAIRHRRCSRPLKPGERKGVSGTCVGGMTPTHHSRCSASKPSTLLTKPNYGLISIKGG